MDKQEARIYYSIVLGLLLIVNIVVYFIYRLLKQHNSYQARMQRVLDREMELCINMRLDIVRDIHDDIGALLGTLCYNIETLKVPEEERPRKEEILQQLRYIISRTRAMPSFPTNSRALLQDLRKFIDSLNNNSISIAIECGELPAFTEQQCVQLSLVLKEIIHNTIKHSGATKLRIQIDCREGKGILKTADNGVGFRTYERGKDWTGGIGIDSILNRVRQLKGVTYMDSQLNGGVKYLLEIPLCSNNN